VFLTKDPPAPPDDKSVDIAEFDLLKVGFSLRLLLTGVVSRLLGSLPLSLLLFSLNLGIFILLKIDAKRPPLLFFSSTFTAVAEEEALPALAASEVELRSLIGVDWLVGVFQVSPPSTSSSSLMELLVGDGGAFGGPSGGSLPRSFEAAPTSPSLDIVELHSEATVRLDSGRSVTKKKSEKNQNRIYKTCKIYIYRVSHSEVI
jgi:hypothetical protein